MNELSEKRPIKTGTAAGLRRAPLLGCLIVVMMLCEKMLAHTYTAITIYVLPAPWKWVVPGLHHPVTYTLSALVYCLHRHTVQIADQRQDRALELINRGALASVTGRFEPARITPPSTERT